MHTHNTYNTKLAISAYKFEVLIIFFILSTCEKQYYSNAQTAGQNMLQMSQFNSLKLTITIIILLNFAVTFYNYDVI